MNTKYTFFIIAAIIIMIVLSAGQFISDAIKPLTIQDITGYSANDCAAVRTGDSTKQRKKYDVEAFKKSFGTAEFKSLKVEADNTTHTYYICLDNSGTTLFTLVDVGNDSDYYIKAGNFNIASDAKDSLYQAL